MLGGKWPRHQSTLVVVVGLVVVCVRLEPLRRGVSGNLHIENMRGLQLTPVEWRRNMYEDPDAKKVAARNKWLTEVMARLQSALARANLDTEASTA